MPKFEKANIHVESFIDRYAMSILPLGNVASSIPSDGSDPSVQIAVLKKSLDASSSAALALINALPPVQRLPSHLGTNVNTSA
jgi:hypothetical protein